MARPRRSDQSVPIDAQLRGALFECIVDKGFQQTRISDITEIVGCNRGTFYYYFKDIYELRDALIDASIPRDLPFFIINLFLAQRVPDAMSSKADDAIERVSMPDFMDVPPDDALRSLMEEEIRADSEKIKATACLLASDIGDVVASRIESQAIGFWCSFLGVGEGGLDQEVRIILEFLLGGLLKVFAFMARNDFKSDIQDIVRPLAPEVPIAVFSCLDRALREAH